MNPPLIKARDLSVTIDGTQILHNISLDLGAGEFLAVLGHNGSGKSTLIRSLLGLQRFDGQITLFGTPLAKFTEWSRLGYVSQESDHTTGVPSSVLEVVLSGTMKHHRWLGWPSRAERAEAAALIERVGLSKETHRPVSELSGGQRQRTRIARALMGNPDVLVMDEPTVGVDAQSIGILVEILREELTQGNSVIMVTHELGAIQAIVNRSITLEAGRVCESCTEVLDVHAEEAIEHYLEHHADSHSDADVHHVQNPSVRPVVSEGPLQ